MGRTHEKYISANRIYGCKACSVHFAAGNNKISDKFNGAHGKAYLFDVVVNVIPGEPVERHMTTGLHIVRDISCMKCGTVVGWTYDKAYVESQKYKEGKFILERELICKINSDSD